MKKLLLTTMASATLAACAGHGGAKPEAAGAAWGSIKPPTPADVATRVGEADAGKTVSIKVGDRLAVELVGVPTAGYLWDVLEKPAFLSADGTFGGPTSTAQLQPGFAGGSHWEVLVFRATASGEGVLKLVQKRPWETTPEPGSKTFGVTVRAE